MQEEINNSISKPRLLAEIAGCFIVFQLIGTIVFGIADAMPSDSRWWSAVVLVLSIAAVIAYVLAVEKKSLESIGLQRVALRDIGIGFLLGVIVFILQQIPMLAMGIDYKQFASPPDWTQLFIDFVFILVLVGIGEEIAFRGFILHKSEALFHSKAIAVILNCLLFYAIHWPPVRFVGGEFFSTSLTTIVLCVYLYRSKNKSIVPLIVAHYFYDIFVTLVPTIAYYIYA